MVADLRHFQYVVFSLFWDEIKGVLSFCCFLSCHVVVLSHCRLVVVSYCRFVVLWASLFIYNYHLLILHYVLFITN